MKKRYDIFCRVVDNFGDIGVCWRLARQLQKEHGLSVRLYVDNLQVAQKIIPIININKTSQIIDNIEVLNYNGATNFSDAADVVIETFSCGLPETYQELMSKKQSKWVNLEYLSAERWVGEFHGKPSPQANGLIRYFYYPGFTDMTGGLIREQHLSIPSTVNQTESADVLNISLFCYPNVSLQALLGGLSEHDMLVNLRVPQSEIWSQIAAWLGVKSLEVGSVYSRENLQIHALPFLSQDEYDALLRACDVNFVRGEDSWVRAIWAGKPFIWQPYVQEENTHIKKLEAFLDMFYADLDQKEMLRKAHIYWSAGQGSKTDLSDYLHHLSAILKYTAKQSYTLAKLNDLASKLVIFCNNLVFTKT